MTIWRRQLRIVKAPFEAPLTMGPQAAPNPAGAPAGGARPARAAASDAPVSLDGAFRAYAGYVAAIALKLLGRDHEVDDVVQDVFVAGHKGLRALRDPDAIKGWLATVTVRVARRRLWLRKFRSFLGEDEAGGYANVASNAASPEERSLVAELYAALDELPVEQRVAWVLRHLEEEDLASVARACSCSLATAKRRIQAAHEAIERRLA
jgi:RNA polymerase sigma-70 factor, ECF subfamily